jgi:hypothetical protein
MGMRWGVMSGALLGLAVGCASHKTVQKLDDSGLARLDEQQMQPVDDARIEEGHAHDALAKARSNEAEARSRVEVAKSERDVAEAQLKRSSAELDMLKKQYADRDAIAHAENDIRSAQERIKATGLKQEYLNKMIGISVKERELAEAHVDTAAALTEQAKFRAMKAGNAPQVESMNGGSIDARVAELQVREGNLRKDAADQRSGAVDLYNRWQQLDAQVRTTARPENLAVPAPAMSEPSK